MVFCYQNCSHLLCEKIVLVIEKKNYSNSKRSEQFLVTECFFNLFLDVSHIYLEQLGFNWKKLLGFGNMQEKLENIFQNYKPCV